MIKIFTCYSDSHAAFAYRHFLPSVPCGVPVVSYRLPQDCERGHYDDKDWGTMAARKLRVCMDAVADGDADMVFMSDIDARWYFRTYGDMSKDFQDCLKDFDIVFQNDGRGKYCSGSWLARPSTKLFDVFVRAIELLPQFNGHDQPAMNCALAEAGHTIKHGFLPPRYWGHGSEQGALWEPGMPVQPPADLVLHQANWCKGATNKLMLLEAVQKAHREARLREASPDVQHVPLLVESPPLVPSIACTALAQTPKKPPVIRFSRSPMAEAKIRSEGKHPLNAPALVLQFWEGDKEHACELAELIADIEPTPRKDVLFVFAAQAGTKIDVRVEKAMERVGLKFGYVQITTKVDPAKSYPGVCFDPWASAVSQMCDKHFNDELRSHSAFFFEADGCPASRDWIDRLTDAHNETISKGKWFTGAEMHGRHYDRHLNGSLIVYLPAWLNLPSLHRCPADHGWDLWHGPVILANGCDTRRILNEYDLSYTRESFNRLSGQAAWFSSNKDRTAHLWARRLLVKG